MVLILLANIPECLATPRAVLIIRHGEEHIPEDGPHLSEKGWRRAKKLPTIFARFEFAELGIPDILIGALPTKGRPSVRSIETLEYIASTFGLEVETPYSRGEESDLAADILEKKHYDGKFVMIAWQHGKIEKLAEKLGFKKAPDWEDGAYDRMWLLEYKKKKIKFQDLPQHLLPGDSVSVGPLLKCKKYFK